MAIELNPLPGPGLSAVSGGRLVVKPVETRTTPCPSMASEALEMMLINVCCNKSTTIRTGMRESLFSKRTVKSAGKRSPMS